MSRSRPEPTTHTPVRSNLLDGEDAMTTPRLQSQRVGRRTLPDEIRDSIRTRIERGQLRPGAQVPSERQLSEDFGVARTSLREAIQALISLGLVERRGNRTFVTDDLHDLALEELDTRRQRIEELFDVRRL